jgi:hypothetical protein
MMLAAPTSLNPITPRRECCPEVGGSAVVHRGKAQCKFIHRVSADALLNDASLVRGQETALLNMFRNQVTLPSRYPLEPFCLTIDSSTTLT